MADKMLELNNEMIRTFKQCPKKYWWRYVEKVEPVRTEHGSVTMEMIITEAIAMAYDGRSREEIINYIHAVIAIRLKTLPPEEEEPVMIMKYILLGMIQGNPGIIFDKKSDRIFFKLLVTDEAAYSDVVPGLIVLYDNNWLRSVKVTSQTFSQFEDRMKVSFEATGALWAMRKSGIKVEGIMYDYIKKPALRKGAEENMHQFGARIVADYESKTDLYYGKCFVERTDEELDIFEKDLLEISLDIYNKYFLDSFNRNTDACYHLNTPCPYLSICHTKRPDEMMLNLYYKQNKQGDKNAT